MGREAGTRIVKKENRIRLNASVEKQLFIDKKEAFKELQTQILNIDLNDISQIHCMKQSVLDLVDFFPL